MRWRHGYVQFRVVVRHGSLCALGKPWRLDQRYSSDLQGATEFNDTDGRSTRRAMIFALLPEGVVASRSSLVSRWMAGTTLLVLLAGCGFHHKYVSVDKEHLVNWWKYHGPACHHYPYSCPPCPYCSPYNGCWNLPFPLAIEDAFALAKADAGRVYFDTTTTKADRDDVDRNSEPVDPNDNTVKPPVN